MEGLTKTENLIVSRYLSRHPPPKAKELASELGVSVKTVYKALYKYRRLYGYALNREGYSNSGSDGASTRAVEEAELLIEAIYELKASIDRLNETLNRLLTVIPSANTVQRSLEDVVELPNFVEGNPWLRIIGNRSEG